jgi:hypothetical protein
LLKYDINKPKAACVISNSDYFKASFKKTTIIYEKKKDFISQTQFWKK